MSVCREAPIHSCRRDKTQRERKSANHLGSETSSTILRSGIAFGSPHEPDIAAKR